MIHSARIFREFVLGQAARSGLFADPIAKALKLLNVQSREPLVFLDREDDCDLSLLAPDHDRFALRGVNNRG
jgi:hypothetical protein